MSDLPRPDVRLNERGHRCPMPVVSVARAAKQAQPGTVIAVNVAAPMGATPEDIARMGQAHFNVLLYPETGETAARHLERACGQPYTKIIPIGVGATRDFLHEVSGITGLSAKVDESGLRLPWWSASVDSTYLTGKRVYIFGDATHVMAAARIAATEIGFDVVGMGCFNREFARPLRAAAKAYGVDPLITDDYLEVEAEIARLQPELILGTQMERHIGKRLGIPCAVISSPVHVQDFPAESHPFLVKITQRKHFVYVSVNLTAVGVNGSDDVVYFIGSSVHGGFPDLSLL